MKTITKASALASLLLAFVACGSGDEKTDTSSNELNDNTGDNTTTGGSEYRAPATPVEGQTTEGIGESTAPKPDQAQPAIRD